MSNREKELTLKLFKSIIDAMQKPVEVDVSSIDFEIVQQWEPHFPNIKFTRPGDSTNYEE